MSNHLKKAILQAGIIPSESLPEFERWGVNLPENVKPEPNLKRSLEDIREAIESKTSVEFRMTYLDALSVYETSQQTGRLYYLVPDNSVKGQKRSKTTFLEITYAILPSGAYIIPWTDEDISYLLVADGTYLKPMGGNRVYFGDVGENFYGEHKAFVVCYPMSEEEAKLREDKQS